MSTVAVALFLTALVGMLIKTRLLGIGSALICVVLGLVLGGTPAGPTITDALDRTGQWAWQQVMSL